MASKKEKKDGANASLLPKSIAGMKLPKEVRRKLSALAQHPVVADLLAAGLVALAAKLKGEPEAKEADAKPADTAKAASPPAPVKAPALAAASKPVVKRARKPAAEPTAPAKPGRKAAAAKTAVKPAAADKPANGAAKPVTAAALAAPVAKRKRATTSTAKPRAPRTPKPTV